MKKPVKEPKSRQQLEEERKIRAINNAPRKLVTLIKKQCAEGGINAVKMQLEYLKANDTRLPDPLLSKERTIECYNDAIEQYTEELKNLPKQNF